MNDNKKQYDTENWTYAWSKPSLTGTIRGKADDFQVTEIIKHEACGSGEHVYLYVEKCDANTDWVAGLLAKHCGVAVRDVSYAGMKDRRAVTRQWFSVYLPGKPEPDWQALGCEQIRILAVSRHQKKLRRGALSGNRFEITVSGLTGDTTELSRRLETVKSHGVPNYFGEQRFGRDGKNIDCAIAMFGGRRVKRNQRSIYLSAVRSFLFNEILSRRLQNNTWQQVAAGDVLMLSGSNSVFVAEPDQLEVLQQRYAVYDLDITGPLAGDGELMTKGEAAQQEQAVFEQYSKLIKGLQDARLEQARRPLRVVPGDMQWELSGEALILKFFLPAGSYATSVLKELLEYTVPAEKKKYENTATEPTEKHGKMITAASQTQVYQS